jgi:hypothetical protein
MPIKRANPRITSSPFNIGKKYPERNNPVVKLSAGPPAGGGVPRNCRKKLRPKTK